MTWTDFVNEAERRGACALGLTWARSINDWPTECKYGAWVLECMNDRLSDEQVWTIAQQSPWEAFVYCRDRLTDEQVWKLAQRSPWEALRYCRDRLTDEQINQLMEMM